MRNYLTRYFIDAVIYHDRVILSASVNGGGRKETDMSLIERMKLYKTNDRIKDYTDKYMKHHGITEVKSALECMAVKNFIEHVEGGSR